MSAEESFITIRLLEASDYDRGFFKLLSFLTDAPKVEKDLFLKRLGQMKDRYFVLVAIDTNTMHVVGTATLLEEYKFIHSCGLVGHLEDVVVHPLYRKRGIAKTLIERIITLAQTHKCYKLHLDAAENNAGFYEKLGFAAKERQFVKYFANL